MSALVPVRRSVALPRAALASMPLHKGHNQEWDQQLFDEMQGLPSTFNFSRTSSGLLASYYDVDGVLQQAGSSVPRFTHQFSGGEWDPLGLMIEPQRTNVVLYNRELNNAEWGVTRATVTANALVAPNGLLEGDILIESGASGTHFISPSTGYSYTSGTVYTFSVVAKYAGRRWFRLTPPSTVFGGAQSTWFDVQNGVLGTAEGQVDRAAITPLGNGWYRCEATLTASSTDIQTWFMVLAQSDGSAGSYAGDGVSGIAFWAPQRDVGAFATSIIYTTGSAVTRNADLASRAGDGLGATILAGRTPPLGGGPNYIYQADDGTNNNRIVCWWDGSNTLRVRSFVGGVTQSTITFSLGGETDFKVAFNTKAALEGSLDGGALQVGAEGDVPSMAVERLGTDASGANSWNSTIKSIVRYGANVPTPALEALAA